MFRDHCQCLHDFYLPSFFCTLHFILFNRGYYKLYHTLLTSSTNFSSLALHTLQSCTSCPSFLDHCQYTHPELSHSSSSEPSPLFSPSGAGFSGVSSVSVPKGATVMYAVQFRGMQTGLSEGMLMLKNARAAEDSFEYSLRGEAEEPLAEEHLRFHCEARSREKFSISLQPLKRSLKAANVKSKATNGCQVCYVMLRSVKVTATVMTVNCPAILISYIFRFICYAFKSPSLSPSLFLQLPRPLYRSSLCQPIFHCLQERLKCPYHPPEERTIFSIILQLVGSLVGVSLSQMLTQVRSVLTFLLTH